MVTERDILIRLKEGDKDAFTSLYNRYWKQVYNFTRLYIIDINEAEDIVQEVFVKVWQYRELIRENNSFKGYVFIITRNIVFNNSRKQFNNKLYVDTLQEAIEDTYSIDEEIDARSLKELVLKLIKELPVRCQKIFFKSRFEHKTNKQIAEELNISIKTVENQMTKAIKFLRQFIPFFFFLIY